MNTRSASLLKDQVTRFIYQAKTTNAKGGSHDYIAETPQGDLVAGLSNDAPSASVQTKNLNAQFDDNNNNVSVYKPSYIFGSSNNNQALASAV